jgi:hypothetical protein
MIVEKQIEIARKLIATGLVNNVYHSVEIVRDEKEEKYPAYKQGAEQFYIGPDDSKLMYGYIRQNGTVQVVDQKMESGCSKIYKVSAPHRVVVFKDKEAGNFDALVQQLLFCVFVKDVVLVSFTNDAFKLAQQESPMGDFAFDATTFYLAIDVKISVWLTERQCKEDSCIIHSNPICN